MRKVLSEIAAHYSASLAEHGVSARGVGWGDDRKHALRFDKLMELVREEREPFSVNDLGGGYGALWGALQARGYDVKGYSCYDVSAEMLDAARSRIGGDERTRLVHGDRLVEVADFSFASGIFNVKFHAEEDQWTEHMLSTLDNLDAFSRKGFAFNALTSHVDWREDHLYYADPAVFFEHCVTRYSRRVALLHDTELFEWTIVVRKGH